MGALKLGIVVVRLSFNRGRVGARAALGLSFGDCHRVEYAKAHARFDRDLGRFAARQQNIACAEHAARTGSDGRASSSTSQRADDGSNGYATADLCGIRTGGGWTILLKFLSANADVLAVGGGNSNQCDCQSRGAGDASGLRDFHDPALGTRAAFGDDPTVDHQWGCERS